MKNRRDFLKNSLGVGAGFAAAPRLFAAPQANAAGMDMKHMDHATVRSNSGMVSVETPDVAQLPRHMDGSVKEFHLIAEPVKQEIFPGRVVDLWGYNGSAPGPTIQVNQGDRVRIIVDNHLPEATSMHWHGFEIPVEMDGAPGSSQDPIPPGGRFVYEFTLHQAGTFFYHSHMAMQEMMGMIGAFIMTGTEGGRQPKTTWGPKNTVLVGVAEASDVEFVANNPGDWMVHCHLPHHMMNQMSSVVGPMTRGSNGMPAGLGMEEGMGILREGHATSDDKGPSLGRGMGVGSTRDQMLGNGPLSTRQAKHSTGNMLGMQHEGMQMTGPEVAKDANSVPGFPQ